MNRSLTTQDLYDQLHDKLDLHWVGGRDGGGSSVSSENITTSRPALAGYLNLIHPNKVQVIGREENDYLDSLDSRRRWETVAQIFAGNPLAVIVSDHLPVSPDLAEAADEVNAPLMVSAAPSHSLVHYLQYYLSRALARQTNLHGVFMEIFTIGVLITGDAGSGKSELALELLNRGHRLIADDSPEFTQMSPEIIDGTCPAALQDCLEVRGLGVLNIREMFGDAAIKMNKYLRLIVHLEVPENHERKEPLDRLRGDTSVRQVLELDIPSITLPVLAGRNLAVMTEAAVRDFMLKMKGFDATSAFVERHARLIQQSRK